MWLGGKWDHFHCLLDSGTIYYDSSSIILLLKTCLIIKEYGGISLPKPQK